MANPRNHEIRLGFEVGTSNPVDIPLGHLVVTGQTQAAGKTTTLEALVKRSGLKAIAFITKRGEGSFRDAHTIQPFFRERADWVFVSGLIDATLSEKNKILRAWLMKVCRGTKTLAEVQANVKKAQKTARGFSESIYTEIDGYLDLVVPEIANLPPAREIRLENGLNIMDLTAYSTALQALVIRSVVEHVYEKEKDTITVIPEAWEFLPELRGSPCKQAIETLVRKGGGLGNFMWVDSQDLAGVWKLAVRAAKVYLIGVQREANEVKRTLANIPDSVAKPKAKDVAMLELGQFYACWSKHAIKTYVQPSWLNEDEAKQVALGNAVYSAPAPTMMGAMVLDAGIPDPELPESEWSKQLDRMEGEALEFDGENWKPWERKVNEKQFDEFVARTTDILDRLTDQMLNHALHHEGVPAAVGAGEINRNGDVVPAIHLAGNGNLNTSVPVNIDALYKDFKSRLLKDRDVLIKLAQSVPEIEIETTRAVVQMSDTNLQGWLVALISRGFFDKGVTGSAAYTELVRLGKKVAKPGVYGALDKLTEMGAVTKESDGGNKVYVRNPELKITRRDK